MAKITPPASPEKKPKDGPKAPSVTKAGSTGKSPTQIKARTEPKSRRFFDTLGHNLMLATLAGVLAFMGGVVGTIATADTQRTIWEGKVKFDQQQQLVEKRIEYFEKTVVLFSMGFAVYGMEQESIKQTLQTAGRVALNPTSIIDVVSKKFREQTISNCKNIDSRAEYVAILSMDAVLYGDNTKQAVKKLMKFDPWWEADSLSKRRLITAMENEFSLGFTLGDLGDGR